MGRGWICAGPRGLQPGTQGSLSNRGIVTAGQRFQAQSQQPLLGISVPKGRQECLPNLLFFLWWVSCIFCGFLLGFIPGYLTERDSAVMEAPVGGRAFSSNKLCPRKIALHSRDKIA